SSPFALLNDHLSDHLVYVEVKEEGEVSLEITHIASPSRREETGSGEIRSPRLFVSAGKDSRVHVVEHFNGYGECPSVTNHVAEFVLEENANVTHVKLQSEDVHAIHISSVFSEQAKGSCFKNINLQFGAAVSRNEIYPSLPASGSEA